MFSIKRIMKLSYVLVLGTAVVVLSKPAPVQAQRTLAYFGLPGELSGIIGRGLVAGYASPASSYFAASIMLAQAGIPLTLGINGENGGMGMMGNYAVAGAAGAMGAMGGGMMGMGGGMMGMMGMAGGGMMGMGGMNMGGGMGMGGMRGGMGGMGGFAGKGFGGFNGKKPI